MAIEISRYAQGVSNFIGNEEMIAKIDKGKKLRVKLGIDPTSPHIHLGHTVILEKLRQFQEGGHQAVLVIGDFTATIGDPSGRSETRPPLSREEVLENAKTYLNQVFKILDERETEVFHNSEWFLKMSYPEVLKLNSRITLQQVLQREDFKKRREAGEEIRLHEIQYPIMQGWDSVKVKADVELGGTDQLFNLLVGRDLQEQEGQKPQSIITMPLLIGTDGTRKMSKSYHNEIGISENPDDIFAKVLSIPDTLIENYFLLLLGENFSLKKESHPLEEKKKLALAITKRFHDEEKAKQAQKNWENRVSAKDWENAKLPLLSLSQIQQGITLLELAKLAFQECGEEKSNGEIRKQFILSGGIQLNGKKQTNPNQVIKLKVNDVLRLGKKYAIRFQK